VRLPPQSGNRPADVGVRAHQRLVLARPMTPRSGRHSLGPHFSAHAPAVASM
jgi:hypothetical protein